MRTRHFTKLVSSALGLIVLGCLWFYLAPAALGGSTTYVVTDGISMEPRFHTGDLAVVRSRSSYHVGEIVAYHNKMLHTIVLHRIIGRAGNRYLFKGDNNNFVDFEHPLASQLIGALWLHIPGAGARLQSIRSPALMGILVAVGVLLISGAAFTRRRRRRRRHRREGEHGNSMPTHLPRHPGEPVTGVLAIGLIALLPFIALALLAFTRAPTARRPFNIPYTQNGSFSYSANATSGPAYPGNRAVTGDTLFTHVLSDVNLRFGYLFTTSAKHSLTGKASLSATISSTNGWHTTLQLGQPTHFHGDHGVVTATLDLTSLVALVHRVQATTAVSSGSYTLTIVPNVSANGNLNLVPLHTTFSPAMKFSLSELEVQPTVESSSSVAAAKAAANQFAPSASGSVTGKRSQALFLSFGIARLSVATARAIALGGIAIVAFILLAVLKLVRPRLKDEVASIRARYGHLIVPVARVSQLPGIAVIDVADMDALARIAAHYDRSILYEATDERQAFWVTDESGQFRYTVGTPIPSTEHEVVAPARTQDDELTAPAWEESDHVAALAWTESEQAPAPAWTENYEIVALMRAQDCDAVDQRAAEVLAREVYVDELELGGVFAAAALQSPPESAASAPATDRSGIAPGTDNGWIAPATDNGWGTHDGEADTFVRERKDSRAAGAADASPTPAGATATYITGLEWTTNS
jgi:signal peptidase I